MARLLGTEAVGSSLCSLGLGSNYLGNSAAELIGMSIGCLGNWLESGSCR